MTDRTASARFGPEPVDDRYNRAEPTPYELGITGDPHATWAEVATDIADVAQLGDTRLPAAANNTPDAHRAAGEREQANPAC